MSSPTRRAFEKFAQRQIDSGELAAATGMVWKFKDSMENPELLHPVEVVPPVEVTGKDILRALEDHQRGVLSSTELQEWASLIVLCDSYQLPSTEAEPLATVLHRLASPELFGELTADSIGSLRSDLNRMARR